MPKSYRLRSALEVFTDSYTGSATVPGAVSLPLTVTRAIDAPSDEAVNPIYRVKFTPTSGTAATLPGSIILNTSGPALSSLTGTLTTTKPLESANTWIGLLDCFGLELIARTLPYTTAEIDAAAPSAPSSSRNLAGTISIDYTDTVSGLGVNVFFARFATNAISQENLISIIRPYEFANSENIGGSLAITIALTTADLNTELELLVLAKG